MSMSKEMYSSMCRAVIAATNPSLAEDRRNLANGWLQQVTRTEESWGLLLRLLLEHNPIHGVFAAQQLRTKVRRDWVSMPLDSRTRTIAGLWSQLESCAARSNGIPSILAECNAAAAAQSPGGCIALCQQIARRLTDASAEKPSPPTLQAALLQVLLQLPRELDRFVGPASARQSLQSDLDGSTPAVLAALASTVNAHRRRAGVGTQYGDAMGIASAGGHLASAAPGPGPGPGPGPRPRPRPGPGPGLGPTSLATATSQAPGLDVLAAWGKALPSLTLRALASAQPTLAEAMCHGLAFPHNDHATARAAAEALAALVPATSIREQPQGILGLAASCSMKAGQLARRALESGAKAASPHEAEQWEAAVASHAMAAVAVLEAAPAWVCGPAMAMLASSTAPPLSVDGSRESAVPAITQGKVPIGKVLLEVALELTAMPSPAAVYAARSAWVALECLEPEEGGAALLKSGLWSRVALVAAMRCEFPADFVPSTGCWSRFSRGIKMNAVEVPAGRGGSHGSLCDRAVGYMHGEQFHEIRWSLQAVVGSCIASGGGGVLMGPLKRGIAALASLASDDIAKTSVGAWQAAESAMYCISMASDAILEVVQGELPTDGRGGRQLVLVPLLAELLWRGSSVMAGPGSIPQPQSESSVSSNSYQQQLMRTWCEAMGRSSAALARIVELGPKGPSPRMPPLQVLAQECVNGIAGALAMTGPKAAARSGSSISIIGASLDTGGRGSEGDSELDVHVQLADDDDEGCVEGASAAAAWALRRACKALQLHLVGSKSVPAVLMLLGNTQLRLEHREAAASAGGCIVAGSAPSDVSQLMRAALSPLVKAADVKTGSVEPAQVAMSLHVLAVFLLSLHENASVGATADASEAAVGEAVPMLSRLAMTSLEAGNSTKHAPLVDAGCRVLESLFLAAEPAARQGAGPILQSLGSCFASSRRAAPLQAISAALACMGSAATESEDAKVRTGFAAAAGKVLQSALQASAVFAAALPSHPDVLLELIRLCSAVLRVAPEGVLAHDRVILVMLQLVLSSTRSSGKRLVSSAGSLVHLLCRRGDEPSRVAGIERVRAAVAVAGPKLVEGLLHALLQGGTGTGTAGTAGTASGSTTGTGGTSAESGPQEIGVMRKQDRGAACQALADLVYVAGPTSHAWVAQGLCKPGASAGGAVMDGVFSAGAAKGVADGLVRLVGAARRAHAESLGVGVSGVGVGVGAGVGTSAGGGGDDDDDGLEIVMGENERHEQAQRAADGKMRLARVLLLLAVQVAHGEQSMGDLKARAGDALRT